MKTAINRIWSVPSNDLDTSLSQLHLHMLPLTEHVWCLQGGTRYYFQRHTARGIFCSGNEHFSSTKQQMDLKGEGTERRPAAGSGFVWLQEIKQTLHSTSPQRPRVTDNHQVVFCKKKRNIMLWNDVLCDYHYMLEYCFSFLLCSNPVERVPRNTKLFLFCFLNLSH